MELRLQNMDKKWYVFLDNCRIHKGKRTKAFVEERGIRLLFNQAYHPEYNGIEGFWSQMKRHYRRALEHFKTKHIQWDQFQLVRDCFDMTDNEYALSYSRRGLSNILKIPPAPTTELA